MCEKTICNKCDKTLIKICTNRNTDNCITVEHFDDKCKCNYHNKKYHTYVSGRRIYATMIK